MFEHCTFKNNAIIIMHTFNGVYLHVIFSVMFVIFSFINLKKNGKL